MRPNRLREMFAARQTALCGWMAINSPYAAELMGHSGYDTVVVDLQHGPLYLDAAVPMLQALSSTPAMPMARCSGNNFFEINKLLDAGAYGIICPMINTPEDARQLVSACRYPPQGTRSFGPARGLLYGGADYFDHANTSLVVYAMIETSQGMANLDAICAVEGLDGVLIGPADLSLGLGVPPPPRWREEPLASACDQILAAARRAGKMCAVFCVSPQMGVDMKKKGHDLIVVGMDAVILRQHSQEKVDFLRKA